LQKRYVPIAIVTGILLLVAMGGYLVPANSQGPPVRVLLDNKGGKVILNHAEHIADMGGRCMDCHHNSDGDPNPPACSSCHVAKFGPEFAAAHQQTMDRKQCASCHHAGATIDAFNHAEHAEDYAADDCAACHHDRDIEPEPQACSNCHTDGNDARPSLRDAAHVRCAECHDDMFTEGVVGCARCHERRDEAASEDDYRPCADCHATPADQLIPTTTAAFHAQCRGCHEENGSGPFGDDACYQCHMK
jgi:hypothetical protein